MRFTPLFLAFMLGLSGCATPAGFTDKPMQQYDRDTSYAIEDNPKGFTVTVYLSRYQFIPETDAVITAAKSAALSIAHETADSRGRRIRQVNEQRIRVSTGRNGLTGITSCTVQATAEYE